VTRQAPSEEVRRNPGPGGRRCARRNRRLARVRRRPARQLRARHRASRCTGLDRGQRQKTTGQPGSIRRSPGPHPLASRQLEDRSTARHATEAASEDWGHSPCRRQPASTQTKHQRQHHSEDYCERKVDELELQGGQVYLHLAPAGTAAARLGVGRPPSSGPSGGTWTGRPRPTPGPGRPRRPSTSTAYESGEPSWAGASNRTLVRLVLARLW
jgi:hypothetical protein